MNSTDARDLVLVVDGGGMAAIFAAGALEVLHERVRDRVAGVYATSAGAEMGIYFVSGQAKIPPRFTIKYLTRPEFIPGHLLRYLVKIFAFGGKSAAIPDYIDIDYFIPTAQGSSDCVLDLGALKRSPVEFFVKVVDIDRVEATYLSAKQDPVDKLRATSQCGPFSTKAVTIDGKRYVDGGTIHSDLDLELVRQNPDKQFFYVQSSLPDFRAKALLYPLYVLAGLAIMRLYGRAVGWRYITELFLDPTEKLDAFPNVTFIRNPLGTSTFCQDKAELQAVYEQGKMEAEKALVY